jgi:hypothetical protein
VGVGRLSRDRPPPGVGHLVFSFFIFTFVW